MDPDSVESAENLTGPQRVSGQVLRPGGREMIPVPGLWVTLHRVGSDRAAPIDSMRSGSDGRYAFVYRRTGDREAVYFVSTTHNGIAYFTPPLHHAVVTGDEAELAVFDTTTAPIPISIRGHHVIVSAVDAQSRRNVTEVFELANDTTFTRVSAGDDLKDAAWSTVIPRGATNMRVTQGDFPGTSVKFTLGKAAIFAPLAPGIRQFVFSYDLPATAFPLSMPVESSTAVYEVLLEDDRGTVTGARIREVEPVSAEQRTFKRFLASDVPARSIIKIDLPATSRQSTSRNFILPFTVGITGTMAAALAWALKRK